MIVELNLFILGTSEQIQPSYRIRMTRPAATAASKLDARPIQA